MQHENFQYKLSVPTTKENHILLLRHTKKVSQHNPNKLMRNFSFAYFYNDLILTDVWMDSSIQQVNVFTTSQYNSTINVLRMALLLAFCFVLWIYSPTPAKRPEKYPEQKAKSAEKH